MDFANCSELLYAGTYMHGFYTEEKSKMGKKKFSRVFHQSCNMYKYNMK